MRVFADRREAGRALGQVLRDGALAHERRRVVVLAIPRGGVPVGAEVADALGAELDVVVVRKLRAPSNPEFAFGAIAADGHVDVDADLARRIRLDEEDIRREVADRRRAVAARVEEYRAILPEPDVGGAVAVIVDDGIATGATARQACAVARRQGAERVLLAAPVGPPDTAASIGGAADEVVVLSTPEGFAAVGQSYADFTQLDDEEVRRTLRGAVGNGGLA